MDSLRRQALRKKPALHPCSAGFLVNFAKDIRNPLL